MKLFATGLIGALFLSPSILFAQASFLEIMFDPPSSDTGREWVLIQNVGEIDIPVKELFLYEEGVKHKVSAATSSLGVISQVIGPNEKGVIADNPSKFLLDYPNYQGAIFDSVFSLKNTGEILRLMWKEVVVDEFTPPSPFAETGDGKIWQKQGGQWSTASSELGGVTLTSTSDPEVQNVSEQASESNGAKGDDVGVWIEQPMPKILVRASAPGVQTAGVASTFQAYSSIKGKELTDGVRYYWNFGNGAVQEGVSVAYAYPIVGKYAVSVTAASDKLSSTHYQTIEVLKPALSFLEKVPGQRGWIVLKNNENTFVEISGYLLRSSQGQYALPPGTFLAPYGRMGITSQQVGFTIDESLEIHYPNGEFLAR